MPKYEVGDTVLIHLSFGRRWVKGTVARSGKTYEVRGNGSVWGERMQEHELHPYSEETWAFVQRTQGEAVKLETRARVMRDIARDAISGRPLEECEKRLEQEVNG